MTRWPHVAAVAGLLGWAVLASAALADEAADAFKQQFGQDLAAVTATTDAADDVALAARMLEAARADNVPLPLLTLLCEKAYDLASKQPEGARAAIEAMRLLAEKVPGNQAACQDKILDVHQAAYARARGVEKVKAGEALAEAVIEFADARTAANDFEAAANLYRRAMPLAANLRAVNREEVKARLEYTTTRQGFVAQVDRLKDVLKANPKDQAARDDLVRIYVVEFNNPAAASKQLDLKADNVNAKYVLLAGMSVDRLPPRALLELGRWYRGLAEKSSVQGRLIALTRAQAYFDRYLQKETEEDAKADGARALEEVDAELAKVVTAMPKLTVLEAKEFAEKYARFFPPASNLAADGKAAASSHWGSRRPVDVFLGEREGDAWSLNGPEGWFAAKWLAPVRGRYIVLFARTSSPGGDPWGNTSVSVNGARTQRIEGMASGRVLLVDLGLVVPISAVRLDIKGSTYPGLAGVEIHREMTRPPAPESPTAPAGAVE